MTRRDIRLEFATVLLGGREIDGGSAIMGLPHCYHVLSR
jgi:hypothetical protein